MRFVANVQYWCNIINQIYPELIMGEAAKNDSEWQVLKVPYAYVNYAGKNAVSEKIAVRRLSDEFTVLCIQTARPEERTQTFLCRGKFEEFRFVADRFDVKNQEVSQKYIVHTNYPLMTEHDTKMTKAMAKNIAIALLEYPPGIHFDDISVNEVVFDISPSGFYPPQFVTLEGLNA